MAHNITNNSATWDSEADLPDVLAALSKLWRYHNMDKRHFESEVADKERELARLAAEKAEYEAEKLKRFPEEK